MIRFFIISGVFLICVALLTHSHSPIAIAIKRYRKKRELDKRERQLDVRENGIREREQWVSDAEKKLQRQSDELTQLKIRLLNEHAHRKDA